MNTNELLWSLLGMALVIWFFFDNLRARERALHLARQICEQAQIQFLDETVALTQIGIRRSVAGLVFRRVYQFEYVAATEIAPTPQYERRGKSWIILHGLTLDSYHHPVASEISAASLFQNKL